MSRINGSRRNNSNLMDNNSLTTDTEEQVKKLQAEVQLLKSMIAEERDTSGEDLEMYLSDKERVIMKKMNTMSNKITEQSVFVKDILNKPVMEIVHNWSATHQDILHDTADLFTQTNVIENMKNNNKWWQPLGTFLKQFIHILTSGERMFYVGLTVLFVGLIFVFINITS
jgi:hypothetical protein